MAEYVIAIASVSRYFGMDKEQLIDASISLFLPGIDDQPLDEFLAPFMSSVDDTDVGFAGGEVDVLRSTGEKFVAEINASQLTTPEHEIYVISLRDVTGRRDAERSLRENEERYRALVENAPEAIVVLDVGTNRFIDANDNACQLFNLSRARLLSIGPQAISPRMQPDACRLSV